MKIYTRTGDDGGTGLIGGTRVRKSDPRIECFGAVDELNATIGLAAVVSASPLTERLRLVQAELFVLGSRLATPEDRPGTPLSAERNERMVAALEGWIDESDGKLPPLRNFILPGGSETAARLHVARTVCRRAERALVGAEITAAAWAYAVRYLNRLSDWLFVEARLANQMNGIADVIWSGE